MKLTVVILAVSVFSIANSAWGQEMQLLSRTSLGQKANAGACFTPDGKKILFANIDSEKESVNYELISVDGKDKTQVYKFKLGRYAQGVTREVNTFLSNQRGTFSADGDKFLTCPNLSKKEFEQYSSQVFPVVACGMDGQTTPIQMSDKLHQVVGDYSSGTFLANNVFGKDDVAYSVLGVPTKQSDFGVGKITKYDFKTKQVATLIDMNAAVAPVMAISPDGSRLAGIAFKIENASISGVEYMSVLKMFWAYDIPSGEIAYSTPLDKQSNNPFEANTQALIPTVIWSQDNSTVYAAVTGMGVKTGLKVFKPFESPQKPTEQEAKELKALAVQLGDEDAKKRDSASARLLAAGMKAIGVLEEASQSTDPEIAVRVKKILPELKGKVATLMGKQNIQSFIELTPGYLYLMTSKPDAISIVDVASGKIRTVPAEDKLMLIDKAGDLGLFRDIKDQSLWTAKIVFTAASQPAASADTKPATANP